MAETTITALSTAGGIDGAADWLAIDTASPSATNKISRNILLGVTGQPADISSVQTFTNKVIGNTNTLTLKDTLFTLQDDGDTTKQAKFQLSGITTATTRTYTLPNVTDTLVSLTASQTLTNKTLTAPAITGGTIDNTTITVDSIAGHTSSTIVTVANLQISNGVLNTANAVTATSIAAGAVQPQALQSGTGSGWSWQSWSPTVTNFTTGNGTVTAKYVQMGKTVFARLDIVLGNTSAVTGSIQFTLPVTSISYPGTATTQSIGQVIFFNGGGTLAQGWVDWFSTTKGELLVATAGGTYVTQAPLSSSAPFTWAVSMEMHVEIVYEAA